MDILRYLSDESLLARDTRDAVHVKIYITPCMISSINEACITIKALQKLQGFDPFPSGCRKSYSCFFSLYTATGAE